MSKKEIAAQQFQFLQKYLNSARKEGRIGIAKKSPKNDTTKKCDDWLTKKAVGELHKEVSINKVKRKTFGSVSAPKAKTNKRFLQTTLGQIISHNKRELNKTEKKSNEKLKDLDRHQRLRNSKQKFGERQHEYKKPEKRKSYSLDG